MKKGILIKKTVYANTWRTLEESGLKNKKLLIVCWKLQIFTKNEIHIRTILMKTVFCNRCQVPCTLHKQSTSSNLNALPKSYLKRTLRVKTQLAGFCLYSFPMAVTGAFLATIRQNFDFQTPANFSFPTMYGMASFEKVEFSAMWHLLWQAARMPKNSQNIDFQTPFP